MFFSMWPSSKMAQWKSSFLNMALMPVALFTHVTQSVVVVRLFQFFVFLFLIFAVLIVFGVWAILSKNSVSYVVLHPLYKL